MGKGTTSLISLRPVAKRTSESSIKLKPELLTAPCLRRSKYHSYCCLDNPSSSILKLRILRRSSVWLPLTRVPTFGKSRSNAATVFASSLRCT
nr:hypothetical protein Iba_chr08eCG3620 [Ipomoea batatas]